MTKSDRRVERTRTVLKNALIELMSEGRYGEITIQDIVDRANVGRTTFYLHYNSKEELFLSCHESMVGELHFGPLAHHSPEELLSPMASPGMESTFRHLEEKRALLYQIFRGKDSHQLLPKIREWNTQQIETNLHSAFAEADSAIPFDVLAEYLAGAQIALVQWWLEKRQSITHEKLAQSFHRLQRAAIRESFGVEDGE